MVIKMNIMKKVRVAISVALVGVMCLSAAACGAKKEEAPAVAEA